MKLTYSPNAEAEFRYTCEPNTAGRKAAIDAMRHWSNVEDLVAFAEARHGYEDTDGFFGITYPTDLDEFELANGHAIAEGNVEANAWYGAHDGPTHQLPEKEYLELLKQFLTLNGRASLAGRIDKLLDKIA
jgi:hypothetical protein